MGKQAGQLKITGTFDGLTFYEMGGKFYVRKKGGPTRKQVLNSASFENSRRTIAEFSACSRDAGLLRRSIRYLANPQTACHRRLNKVMLALKNFDRQSVWGERCIERALKTQEARTALMQFDFIKGSRLSRNLFDRISIRKDKAFTIADFSQQLINFPKGAHLLLIIAGHASLDFKNHRSEVTEYESILIDRQTKLKEIVLQPLKKISSLGNDFYILHLQFFTKQGKEYLPHNHQQSDILSIVAINPHLQAKTIKKKNQAEKFSLLEQLNRNFIPLAVPAVLEHLPRPKPRQLTRPSPA